MQIIFFQAFWKMTCLSSSLSITASNTLHYRDFPKAPQVKGALFIVIEYPRRRRRRRRAKGRWIAHKMDCYSIAVHLKADHHSPIHHWVVAVVFEYPASCAVYIKAARKAKDAKKTMQSKKSKRQRMGLPRFCCTIEDNSFIDQFSRWNSKCLFSPKKKIILTHQPHKKQRKSGVFFNASLLAWFLLLNNFVHRI